MAKLERKHLKVFASNAEADKIGQFGSAVAGQKVETGDIEQIQALDNWGKGWSEGAVSGNRYPALQERNGIDKVTTYQLAYLLQEGIPEWNDKTEYSSTSVVKTFDGNTIVLYKSNKDGNIGHRLTEKEYWTNLYLGGEIEYEVLSETSVDIPTVSVINGTTYEVIG